MILPSAGQAQRMRTANTQIETVNLEEVIIVDIKLLIKKITFIISWSLYILEKIIMRSSDNIIASHLNTIESGKLLLMKYFDILNKLIISILDIKIEICKKLILGIASIAIHHSPASFAHAGN
jgi:hypothetical protein